MHFFHSADDTFLPWTGVMTGMFIASIYYWCTDQVRKSCIVFKHTLKYWKAR